MHNMLDYITWRGDLSFTAAKFNEVDSLILSELAYVNMDGIAPVGNELPVTVAEIYKRYTEQGYDQSFLVNNPAHALKAAAESERFGKACLNRYVNHIDIEKQIQFSACTFYLDDGSIFAAYRGTDNTITGWREDFNMAYLAETPGQAEAAAYLDELLAYTKGTVRVGGHSKGGNFAVYAAAFCKNANKFDRIETVYTHDGPGFNQAIADSPEYAAMTDRIIKIVPDSSIIGMLLSSRESLTAVISDAKGLQQHNPYTWEILGKSFVRAESLAGTFADEALRKWSDSLTPRQWECLNTALFDALEASGADTLHELNSNKHTNYNLVARALMKTDKTVYKGFIEAVKALTQSGKDTFFDRILKQGGNGND